MIEDLKEYKPWVKKCASIILNHANKNPFPRPPFAVDFYTNPPLFCYGRDDQKAQILFEIRDSIKNYPSKLIQIIGNQGIGKSTLICWCAKKINKKFSVPIVYMETSAQPDDFRMKSLYRQIISKLEKSDIIENLLINSIRKLLKIFRESKGKLNILLNEKFSGDKLKLLLSNSEYIIKKIADPTFSQNLFDLLTNNFIILKNHFPFAFDINFLLIFWKAHLQNPEIVEYLRAFKGNLPYYGFNIQTDNDASNNIDNLIELFRWTFDKKTTIVIIFDHLEGGTGNHKEGVYSNLFSLLLNLRPKKHLTIILSGTMDAFTVLDSVLQEDQRLQLDNWAETFALTTLNPNSVIEIINKYLKIFWNNFEYQPSTQKPLFPFGENSIKYLYENYGHDLRKTLKKLYKLIEEYRIKGKLEEVNTFFEAFKVFRKSEEVVLSAIEQRELIKKLLDPNIQDKKRATDVELALYEFFEILRDHPDYDYISDVRHEPTLEKSGKKPDVYLEFFGKLNLEKVKTMGIEVKTYRKMKEVPKNDIMKTYILLTKKDLDYVTWITNVPLKLTQRYNLPDDLKRHMGRISPMNSLELAYIAFIRYFKDIFQRKPTVNEIEFILNRIDLSPIKMKRILKGLTKLTITQTPRESKDITTFVKPSEITEEDLLKKKKVPSMQVKSIEIDLKQVELAVKKYVDLKYKTITKLTYVNTLRAVRKDLNLEDGEIKWDNDIWGFALKISKSISSDQTKRTIIFKK